MNSAERRSLGLELRQMLAKREGLSSVAATEIARQINGAIHRYRENVSDGEALARSVTSDMKWLKSLETHLRQAAVHLDANTDQVDILDRLLAWDAADRFTFTESLYSVAGRIAGRLSSLGRRRGRPRDRLRMILDRDVASILKARGVPLTKARDGTLARVLTVVYQASGINPPGDMFPVVRAALAMDRFRKAPNKN